ncbi:hypothetical protein CY35_13G122700 [Sphagnum magellanicum]|nr:hypothetical protein CY35_13G122700 [Sphagnum magellanicum]
MLLSGGTGSLRMEMERMRVVASSSNSLGLTVESGGGYGMLQQRPIWQSPPVQLDLLPMRSSHSSETNTLAAPASSVTNNPFSSWQMLASRTNSARSGYDDGEVETFSSGGDGAGAAAVGVSTARGDLDMNQLPSTTDCEEEEALVVSSPSSTCMKREREELHVFDLEQDMRADGGCTDLSVSRGASDDEADGGSTTRKKLRLSKEQSALLEESFKDHSTLNPKQKNALAKQLNLRPRQVEVWFQNRRARTKLKQTEVDCEVLKRCCENLSEENRRLQKELQELRALKLAVVATTPRACTAAAVIAAHGFSSYMQRPVLSAATLTMCPSCERVATVENRSAHITFPKPAGSSSSFSHFLQPSAAC